MSLENGQGFLLARLITLLFTFNIPKVKIESECYKEDALWECWIF